MSVNQIQLPPATYAGETFVHKTNPSSQRVTATLETIGTSSSTSTTAATIQSSHGTVYLSTRRLIYVPEIALESTTSSYHIAGKGDRNFESVSIPLDRISDSHLHQPWIGPNGWVAVVAPVEGGGMEPESSMWMLKLVFKDGGVYEFVDAFTKSVEARQRGQGHIEDLPVYTEGGNGTSGNNSPPPYI